MPLDPHRAADSWAARVDALEEDGCHTGATRDEAIAAAAEPLIDNVETGFEEPGRYELTVLSGCVWHDRCDNESCPYGCGREMADHDHVLVDHDLPRLPAAIEVYATAEDADGPCDFDWREVPDA